MVGKLTAALIRKEAEAYRAQGLYEEAIALYNEFLSSTPNVDEALKSDIQSQITDISREMEDFSNGREQLLMSSKEIMQLKDGWRDGASHAEILISAQGLCQIGAYQDALIEFAKLLESGMPPEKVAGSAAECFVKIHNPKNVPAAVEKWLRNIYSETRKVLAVHLLFIKALARCEDKVYVLQYCHYIRSKPRLPSSLVKRLDAARTKYELAIKRSKKKIKSKINSGIRHSKNLAAKSKMSKKFKNHNELKIKEKEEAVSVNKLVDNSNDNDELKTLFSDDGPVDVVDEKPPKKKERPQLNFFKLITVGWLHWVFRRILFKRKR